jgi:hypothetical protein
MQGSAHGVSDENIAEMNYKTLSESVRRAGICNVTSGVNSTEREGKPA